MNEENAFADRLVGVRELLAEWELDGLLIGSSSNRRWLSGFTGSAGWLLVTEADAWLATDFRYWEQAAAQAPDFDLFRLRQDVEVAELVRSAGASAIGIEAQHLTLDTYETLQAAENVTWKPLTVTVEELRAVKTADEVARIREAAAITDKVMALVPTLARPGQSESELAWQLEKRLREFGAEAVAFPVIVASGPNAALPHHTPGARRMQEGDSLIVDMGARVAGYNSDLTRSFYLGQEPDDRFRNIYGTVLSAHENALAEMRAGQTGAEIDTFARSVIADAGFTDEFGHSLGHGVGLEVHEEPRLSQKRAEAPVPAGSVTTVEPGIYVPGWGGVRIEDLVLLTEDGVELLSNCAKAPAIS